MIRNYVISKRVLALLLLVSLCFTSVMIAPTATAATTTISVTDGSVADWTSVTKFNDGTGDATGSGDTDLIKFWVTNDATNLYLRWDIVLATNKNSISSAGYSAMLTSIVPPTGTEPTAELMAFVGFAANGNVSKVALMKNGSESTYSIANAEAIGSGYGATVSVEAKFPFADINTFMGTNKFGPNSSNIIFPLWASTHSSPASVSFGTRNYKDSCPNSGYLSYNSTNGESTPVGTGPIASNSSVALNPNALPGGTITYALTVKNVGDTTGAPRLLFNTMKWTLPNTSFTYQANSTTGIVTTNPTQTATTNNMGVATTTLSWTVPGSLAPGESTTIYFKVTAQNAAGTDLYSQTTVVAQTFAITYDSGNVAPVNLNALYVTPATPINLTSSNTTQTATTLSWSASANASTYNLYDNGVLVKSGLSTTTTSLTGLAINSTHNYTVKAISIYSVESALSNVLPVTTLLPYTITFNSQGGSSVTGTTALHNDTIAAPTSPTKTGYTFAGWYKESGCTNAWVFASDVITANSTIYAKWTPNTYNITFNSQGGSSVTATTALYNTTITAPTAPTKTGYGFAGWYKEPGCTNAWTFASDIITGNTTIYAKWIPNVYNITFDSQGGSSVTATTANYNTTIAAPTSPTKTGYTFGGWYKDAGFTNAWSFASDIVTTTTTLYAKWNINSYTMTFNSQGGTSVSATSANYNSIISEPTAPTKTGYTFAGWYKDSSFTNAWNFASDTITMTTSLYANWTVNSYTVTTNVVGNGSVAPQNPSVVHGGSQGFIIVANSGNRIKAVKYNGTDVKSQLAEGVYTATNIVANSTLDVEFEAIPQYTITVNFGSNGTVKTSPNSPTVFEGDTVRFTVTPDEGYEVSSLTYNGNPVVLTDGKYTTPPIDGAATLNVTFSLKAPIPPTITTAAFSHLAPINLNVKDKTGNQVAKSLNKSFIVYDTITNPDNYELVAYGMYLKDLATGMMVDLKVKNFVFNKQFAVHVFGDGFVFGNQYSLQGYLKYMDNGVVVTVYEQPIFFTWQ